MGPNDPNDISDPVGNGMSVLENIIYSTRDAVTSGVFTLASAANSQMYGTPMREASFDYSSGERKMVWSENKTGTSKAIATGNALLGIASLVPVGGPASYVFLEAPGASNSIETVVKDATEGVHANSKLSTKENTLYQLDHQSGKYLKTGITSKPIPEKRYTNGL